MKSLIPLLAMACLAMPAASAQQAPVGARPPTPEEIFKHMDRNHDGKITIDELPPERRELFKRIDTNVSDITETRIFWLLHADATDLSNVINSLYADSGTTPGGKPGQQKQQAAPQTTVNRTDRALLQSRVVAVPEVRNNALIISAARESMSQIADIITRIDTDVSDITETRIFRLQHADASELSSIVSSIYSNTGASVNGGSQQ